ncbi:DUF1793-domain-containing protein [Stipitochalara longipes BDJ]|nr:DUF1793-domain-containing protein [Stipitochalara longipes BDJ]
MKLLNWTLLAALLDLTSTTSTFKPARPPAIPLAVKSPYLNAVLPAGCGNGGQGYLAGNWPTFWTGQALGWAGMVRIDNTTYTWMGDPGPHPVTQVEFEYSSTRSKFVMEVNEKVIMEIAFLSPVTPEDQMRQSLTSSYLEVRVKSLDGDPHEIQLYTDISAGKISSIKAMELLFSETNDQADWGNWYFGTKKVDGLTFQSGADKAIRGAFQSKGKLANTKDANFRPINKDFPVFGFSVDLGSVTDPVSTLFTLNLMQEQAIRFESQTGNTSLNSLWASYFSKETNALSFFYNDYPTALNQATALDDKIERDSIAIGSQDYLTITSLSVRQAFGATQLVGDLAKQYFFIKELSSDGNIQTVDVIYPFYPILLYLEPSLTKLMLDPLFENQESGHFFRNFAMHDLGSHYPNATGHHDGTDELQPLEERGNMLILALAYAQRANDIEYLIIHYKILKQWTEYLVEETLLPANQMSTDDFAGWLSNQTNLALKGIIGIEAMASIANLTGQADDGAKYSNISHTYVSKWQSLGIAFNATPPHTTLSYNQNDTHGLVYNLYSDRLLNLNLVPQSVYDMQSDFYSTIEQKYGVPLDTRHYYTKSDWEMWAAAISSESTRNMFIRDLAKWINETHTNTACTDLYDTRNGDYATEGRDNHFIARPVVGRHFALLALQSGTGV